MLSANLDACFMIDLSEHSLCGKRLGLFVAREDRSRLEEALHRVLTSGVRTATNLRIRTRTGRFQHVQMQGNPTNDGVVWLVWPLIPD